MNCPSTARELLPYPEGPPWSASDSTSSRESYPARRGSCGLFIGGGGLGVCCCAVPCRVRLQDPSTTTVTTTHLVGAHEANGSVAVGR